MAYFKMPVNDIQDAIRLKVDERLAGKEGTCNMSISLSGMIVSMVLIVQGYVVKIIISNHYHYKHTLYHDY